MKYYVWTEDDDDDSLAWIDSLPAEIVKKVYLLLEGVPVRDWFPGDLVIELDGDGGTELSDAIPTYDGFLVVSDRLKKILEREANANFEFLPVTIRDPRSSASTHPYYAANLLDVVACVDMDKSEYRMDSIIKTQVDRFSRLILDQDRIDPGQHIFRLQEKTNLILLDQVLVDALQKARCTGMLFQPLADHGAVFRKG